MASNWRTVQAARVERAIDLRAFLSTLPDGINPAILVDGRDVIGVQLVESDHVTLGKIYNVVLTLGPWPGCNLD